MVGLGRLFKCTYNKFLSFGALLCMYILGPFLSPFQCICILSAPSCSCSLSDILCMYILGVLTLQCLYMGFLFSSAQCSACLWVLCRLFTSSALLWVCV